MNATITYKEKKLIIMYLILTQTLYCFENILIESTKKC